MRLFWVAGLSAVLSAGTAHAAITAHCESWNGGSEIRCTTRKLSGEAPETHTYYVQTFNNIAWSSSGWWSVCGLAGVIHWIDNYDNLSGSETGERFFTYTRVNKPNECFTVYYYNCHDRLDHPLPCTTTLSVTPAK